MKGSAMRRIHEAALFIAVVAFAAPGIGMQTANAEPRPGAVSSHAPSDLKSKTRPRLARARRRISPKIAASPTNAAPPTETVPAGEDPVFLSDAWLKKEKQTDERLKRFMNICKGC